MLHKNYYIYILANKKYGTIYLGITNNLIKRVYEHKNDLVPGFTKKYQIHTLVYYEITEDIYSAIAKEKQLKKWKIELINSINPQWIDLYYELI